MIKTLLSIFLIFLIVGCTTDSDNEISVEKQTKEETYQVNYLNQALKGKINGLDWAMIGGQLKSSSSHAFRFADTLSQDTCTPLFTPKSRVTFSLDTLGGILLQIGEYPLRFNTNSATNNRTINLIHYIGTTPYSTMVSQGAYEITKVDTINNTVFGKMDAFYDENNYVNGNFEIKYCR